MWVLQETFLNDHSAQEGLSSTIFNNSSKNLASSSQELRLGTSGTTRKRERVKMKRESVEYVDSFTSISKVRGGMLNHTGGTYSHSGMNGLSEKSDFGNASRKNS